MSTLDLSHERLALHRRLERAARSLAYLRLGLALGVLYLLAVPVVLLGDGAIAASAARTRAHKHQPSARGAHSSIAADRSRQLAGTAQDRVSRGEAAAHSARNRGLLIPGALVLVLVVRASEGFAGSSELSWPVVARSACRTCASPSGVGCVRALRRGPDQVRFAARAIQQRRSREPGRHGRAGAGGARRTPGDRTLAIAYWLPERELFVDEHGHPVALPEPNSDRSWTAVEHGGRRVAAIIHDAELEARPELVEAAAAGAVLAFENERLKADLRARLEELRASRKRIVEASLETRKQFERDLHDGAQQRLVSLSIDLEVLRGKLEDEASREFVDAARAKLAEALGELREFARGIHPALLTDRGLAPALEALALRSPVPVELELQLAQRPASSVEAAVYFVVAEALTNVARYAKRDPRGRFRHGYQRGPDRRGARRRCRWRRREPWQWAARARRPRRRPRRPAHRRKPTRRRHTRRRNDPAQTPCRG